MSKIQDDIQLLRFRLQNHKHQTDGFTWNYSEATDEEVMATTKVFPETIDGLTDLILKIIRPKERPKLREQITYLIGLQQRQAQAWSTYIEDCRVRTENVNKWLEANQQKESWAT